MNTNPDLNSWNQEKLQSYIDTKIQESTQIEYKGSGSVGRTDSQKKDIAKVITSMANATGGVVIFGISEGSEREEKHLPKAIDPIDRIQYPREWLEQIIDNNIQPKINNLKIHSIEIDSNPSKVAYVVEIPQSTTAHQNTIDKKYYQRSNFTDNPMLDYQIRDVMNRGTMPDILVNFTFTNKASENNGEIARYWLNPIIENQSLVMVNHLKLEFTFPMIDIKIGEQTAVTFSPERDKVVIAQNTRDHVYNITYRSQDVLFPNDTLELSREVRLTYRINDSVYILLNKLRPIQWTVFADNMLPRIGECTIPNDF